MEDLKIQQKIYDMMKYGNQVLQKFPTYEKHVLAAEIRGTMYKIYRLCITANKKYYKKTTLQDMDVELEVLKAYIKYAADPDVKYLDPKKYGIWSEQLAEIGRMLGGWIKTQKFEK